MVVNAKWFTKVSVPQLDIIGQPCPNQEIILAVDDQVIVTALTDNPHPTITMHGVDVEKQTTAEATLSGLWNSSAVTLNFCKYIQFLAYLLHVYVQDPTVESLESSHFGTGQLSFIQRCP